MGEFKIEKINIKSINEHHSQQKTYIINQILILELLFMYPTNIFNKIPSK